MHLHHLLPALGFTYSLGLAQKSPSSGPSPWEQIHQTLHTYPLAIDFKNAPLFAHVFAPNAVANYTGPLSNLTGLPAITDGLLASVNSLVTQHQLGTTVIDIDDYGTDEGEPDSETAGTANSTTYFTATLFSTAAETAGEFTILFGLYRDEWVETKDTEGPSPWRIVRRQLEFMTPNFGNLTLG